MQNEQAKSASAWDEVKEQVLKDNSRLSDIKTKLKNRDPLMLEDCALLNLLLSEDQGRRSEAQAQRSNVLSEVMMEFTKTTVTLQYTTIELTKRVVRWSRALVVVTGILAFAAFADIVIRLIYRAG